MLIILGTKMKRTTVLLAMSMFAIPGALYADTLIDDFSSSGIVVSGGQSAPILQSVPSVAGGQREVGSVDHFSGTLGGRSAAEVDTSGDGVFLSYETGNYAACQNSVMYGTTIGTVGTVNGKRFWDAHPAYVDHNGSPNWGQGTELNIAATLDDEILIDVTQLANGTQRTYVTVKIMTQAVPYDITGSSPFHGYFGNASVTETGVVAIRVGDLRHYGGTPITAWNGENLEIDGISVESGCYRNQPREGATAFGSLSIAPLFTDTDGDGVEDEYDMCPNTSLGGTVSVGGLDSGVDNIFFEASGCAVSDLVDDIVDDCSDARNHGQFVSCFARGANDLKAVGVLTGKEKGALQSTAAQSDIPE
jgi:hypothetical protein